MIRTTIIATALALAPIAVDASGRLCKPLENVLIEYLDRYNERPIASWRDDDDRSFMLLGDTTDTRSFSIFRVYPQHGTACMTDFGHEFKDYRTRR